MEKYCFDLIVYILIWFNFDQIKVQEQQNG